MKYSDFEFTIDKKYYHNLKHKIETFKNTMRSKKTLFLVIVTTYGVKRNQYFEEMVSEELKMDALFR